MSKFKSRLRKYGSVIYSWYKKGTHLLDDIKLPTPKLDLSNLHAHVSAKLHHIFSGWFSNNRKIKLGGHNNNYNLELSTPSGDSSDPLKRSNLEGYQGSSSGMAHYSGRAKAPSASRTAHGGIRPAHAQNGGYLKESQKRNYLNSSAANTDAFSRKLAKYQKALSYTSLSESIQNSNNSAQNVNTSNSIQNKITELKYESMSNRQKENCSRAFSQASSSQASNEADKSNIKLEAPSMDTDLHYEAKQGANGKEQFVTRTSSSSNASPSSGSQFGD